VGAEGVIEGAGAVAAAVGEHALDGDAAGGEVAAGAAPERGGGVFALLGEDLGIGQPGVVVQGGVQESVAQPGVVVFVAAGTRGAARLRLPSARPAER
jgi:hypothetical protein